MQVLFAGGAGEPCSGSKTPASNSSYLVNLAPGANHDLVTEEMGFARIVSTLFVSLVSITNASCGCPSKHIFSSGMALPFSMPAGGSTATAL